MDETNPAPAAETAGRIVTFTTQWGSYFAGESASFSPIDAEALIARGVAADGAGAAPADLPPDGVVFSTLAGIEHPPRQYPPNPQHPEIPQTFDPSPLHQLQRTARDLAADQPGLAAREELEQFEPDPDFGAGPQPLRRVRPPPAAAREERQAQSKRRRSGDE